MKRPEKDFVALFNALWYQRFPVEIGHPDVGRRAVWTTHIASIIKQIGDMKGYFTCFETGGRTDAVIQTTELIPGMRAGRRKTQPRKNWARIEWEWRQPRFREAVNEIAKLSAAIETSADADGSGGSEIPIFIGYSDIAHHDENMEAIVEQWDADVQLLAFIVRFRIEGGARHFLSLRTYKVSQGKATLVRQQPALPWDVPNSRWKLVADAANLATEAAAELAVGDR